MITFEVVLVFFTHRAHGLGWRIQDAGSLENEMVFPFYITPSEFSRCSLVVQ